MINSKITKTATQQITEDRLFKLLESIDWKLWEMMNMMKEAREEPTSKPLKAVKKAIE